MEQLHLLDARHELMHRGVFVCAIALLAACGSSDQSSNTLSDSAPKSVKDTIAQIMAKPAYAHSHWGILVEDLASGDRLIDVDGQKMFVPGSIMKVYSTAAALKAYGPSYRFHTPVYATGTRNGSTLSGNLVLVASGDYSFGLRERPNGTLAFNSFPEIDHNYASTGLAGPALLKGSDPLAALNQLARQIRAAGITHVQGNVVIDDRLFNTYTKWNDGPVSPMWINENVVDITVAPTDPGEAPAVDWRPKIAGLRVVSNVTTVAANTKPTPLAVQAGPGGVLTVTGTVAAGAQPSLTLWQIPKPGDFARTAFIEALNRAGVTVSALPSGANPGQLLPVNYNSAKKVAEHVSPPLSEFVKVILKVSYNRGADDMVCLVAARNGSRDCEAGLAAELKTISDLGASPESTIVFDGAGTGDTIRTSPADETAVLRSTIGLPWGKYIHDGMAVMGVDGTQAKNQAGTPAAGHIRIKDGTQIVPSPSGQLYISAKTEVGYITAKSGRQLVYAAFVNGVPIGSQDMMQAFESVDRDLSAIAAAIQQGY